MVNIDHPYGCYLKAEPLCEELLVSCSFGRSMRGGRRRRGRQCCSGSWSEGSTLALLQTLRFYTRSLKTGDFRYRAALCHNTYLQELHQT